MSTTFLFRAFAPLPLLLLTVSLCAQAPYQLAWDTLTTDRPLIEASVPTPSGGQFVLTRGTSDSITVVHKFDANGQPLWSRTMTGPTAMARMEAIASDGGEGLFAVRPVRESRVPGSFEPDTFHVEVARIGPDGDPVWARTVALVAGTGIIFTHLRGYRLVTQPNGALDLCLDAEESTYQQAWVIRFRPDGGMERGWTIGDTDSGGFPFFYSDRLVMQWPKAISDGHGGLVIGTRTGPTGPFIITRMDSSGQTLWINRYMYGNNVILFRLQSVAMDGLGRITAYAHIQASTGMFGLVMRIGLDGTVVQADLYDVMMPISGVEMRAKADGGLAVVHWPYNERSMDTGLRMVELDGNGNVITGTWRTVGSVAPDRFIHTWAGSGIVGDRLFAAGTLVAEHNVLANRRYRPLLASYDLGGPLDGCLLAQASIMHHQVPLDLITTTPVTPYQRDMADRSSVTPAVWPSVHAPMPRVLDLCAFTTGMPEAGDRTAGFRIAGNPLATGQELELRDVEAGTIQVFNAMGMLINTTRVAGTAGTVRIGIPQAAGGAYLVQWTSANGAMRHTERFMAH